MPFIKREVIPYLLLKARGEFAVIALAKRHSLFAGDFFVADLLGGVIAGAADAIFDIGGVIEEIVDLIVDGIVFGIVTLIALRARLKAAVHHTEKIRALRMERQHLLTPANETEYDALYRKPLKNATMTQAFYHGTRRLSPPCKP